MDKLWAVIFLASFSMWIWHVRDVAPGAWSSDPWGGVFRAAGMLVVPLSVSALLSWAASRITSARYEVVLNWVYSIVTIATFAVVRFAAQQ